MLFFIKYPKSLIFKQYIDTDYSENLAGYMQFESLAKKLFEQFKFLYEFLGATPKPLNPQDLHIYPLLLEVKQKGYKNLDGSDIRINNSGKDPFGENTHSHSQRYFPFYKSISPYQNHNFCSTVHGTGYEGYTGVSLPICLYTNIEPVIPYFFPTDHNFYTEITNESFLKDSRYDKTLSFPIYHEYHQTVFSTEYFKKVLINPALLKANFTYHENDSTETRNAIRTVNFALRLVNACILINSAFTDLFGFSINKEEMIHHLWGNWKYPLGKKIQGINPFHLNILNYLLSASHMTAYMITYCLYRHKYGEIQDSSHTSLYMGKVPNGCFKNFLNQQIKILLKKHSLNLKKEYENNSEKQYTSSLDNISALIELASIMGIGYDTEPTIGKNYNYSKNINYYKDIVPSEPLKHIDLTIRHNPNSPLWRFWHSYAGRFWKDSKENQQIFKGKGPYWKKNKKHPRSWLYRIGYSYSHQFWTDYFNYLIKTNANHKIIYKKILKSL